MRGWDKRRGMKIMRGLRCRKRIMEPHKSTTAEKDVIAEGRVSPNGMAACREEGVSSRGSLFTCQGLGIISGDNTRFWFNGRGSSECR